MVKCRDCDRPQVHCPADIEGCRPFAMKCDGWLQLIIFRQKIAPWQR